VVVVVKLLLILARNCNGLLTYLLLLKASSVPNQIVIETQFGNLLAAID